MKVGDNHVIDLRSDTVTRPTPLMRAAMADSEVGDDVFGDDPTVNQLEATAASMVDKESAVFVPSGTMGNLTSLLAHCGRGHKVIVGDQAHLLHYEAAGASALGGLMYLPVPTLPDGRLSLPHVAEASQPSTNLHYAPGGVICLENTHNRCGGRVVSPEHVEEVADLAQERGLPVHLDGARIFNASVASGRPVTDWTRHVDSVQFCLSKGLGAPVGSIVAGTRPFVARARRYRKMLGGGMRQAGVLAAAGLIALETMVDRLAEDHTNARWLAERLAEIPGIAIDPDAIETNIAVFEPPVAWAPEAFLTVLKERGVLMVPFGGRRIRAVTHADVSRADCERAIAIVRETVSAPPR
jgi:threonine aldolase